MVLSLNERTALSTKRKRVGRGGSRGGTSGRGMKGQKCRSGGGKSPLFEGGQMPFIRRLPKRGFNNSRFSDETVIFNLGQLEQFFEADQEITRQTLIERGLLGSHSAARVKILGSGELKKRLKVHADAFSASAAEAIVKLGGEARVIKEM